MGCGANVMALTLAAVSSGAATVNEPWSLRATVRPAASDVTVGDLIRLPASADPHLRRMVVFRAPAHDVVLPAATVARLIQRRIPGVSLRPSMSAKIVTIAGVPKPPRQSNVTARRCFRTARALAAGTASRRDDVTPTDCRADARTASLRFNSATRDYQPIDAIPAGGYLGRLPTLHAIAIDRGDIAHLQSEQGPVTVEREVTALQPSRPGHRVFVATADGKILSAPLASNARPRR